MRWLKRVLPLTYCVCVATVSHGQEGLKDRFDRPFAVQAGKHVLDTYDVDVGGHAAPFVVDLDGDGRRDLTVGSFSGQFRFFKNVGTNRIPQFDAKSEWLMTSDQTARVPTWCCVASGPQLVDIDGDGLLDLSAGSYAPGAFYWFKGSGLKSFSARHMLVDSQGLPVFTHPESVYATREDNMRSKVLSYAAQLSWVDWDNDGLLDLLMGNWVGELFVRQQLKEWDRFSFEPPLKSQPVFVPRFSVKSRGIREIRVGDGKAVPDRHSAPAVGDWDGDGLWDIFSGSDRGAVYWFRNTGKPGAPEFKTREEVIPAGIAFQWLEPGQLPKRGGRSQIQVVDYNLDGKPDLLVGDWVVSQTQRTDLTAAERREVQAIREELAVLDRRVGYDFSCYRMKHAGYVENKDAGDRMNALEQKLAAYLVTDSREVSYKSQTNHGHVWVFIRR